MDESRSSSKPTSCSVERSRKTCAQPGPVPYASRCGRAARRAMRRDNWRSCRRASDAPGRQRGVPVGRRSATGRPARAILEDAPIVVLDEATRSPTPRTGSDSARVREAGREPHGDHDRPPALDGGRRRSDRSARPRPRGRGGTHTPSWSKRAGCTPPCGPTTSRPQSWKIAGAQTEAAAMKEVRHDVRLV